MPESQTKIPTPNRNDYIFVMKMKIKKKLSCRIISSVNLFSTSNRRHRRCLCWNVCWWHGLAHRSTNYILHLDFFCLGWRLWYSTYDMECILTIHVHHSIKWWIVYFYAAHRCDVCVYTCAMCALGNIK